MKKKIKTVWVFDSDSNPNKHYQTLLYEDRSTSCDCPGWTRRVQPDGSRTCKHVRLVDAGLADSEARSKKDYAGVKLAPEPRRTMPEAEPAERLGRRFELFTE